MTRNLFSTFILFLLCTTLILFCFIIVSSAQEPEQQSWPAHIGFIYPLSTNGREAPECSNNFSFHIINGVSLNENAFCLSGVGSIILHNVHGAVVSGVFNYTGQHTKGAAIAGVANIAKGDINGVAIAGVANISRGGNGVHIAGLLNMADKVSTVQTAGFMNITRSAEAQVAGFGNIAGKNEAIQVAGFINQAQDANNQVAGFINIAKKVKGVQIAGFINIAEESKYPLGFVNIIKNGEKQIGLSIDEMGNALLGFRSGGSVMYGIIGTGFNLKEEHARYVLEGGIGAHFPFSSLFRVNTEIVHTVMSDIRNDVYFKSGARALAAVKLFKCIEIYAGPSFNYINFDRRQADIRKDRYLWNHQGYSSFNGLFIGALAGIQLNI